MHTHVTHTQVTGKLGSLSKVKELDPDLYRDDAAALKGMVDKILMVSFSNTL